MTAVVETGAFIDEAAIAQAMQAAATKDAVRVREILAKASELDGLDMDEVAVLSSVSDPELLAELFTTARECKEAIYGQRLVLFAPLYISNLCNNDCLYCAFRVRNKELKRRALTQDEIRHEVEVLVDQGHKRILLVAGESYPKDGGFQYVLDSIGTIYDVKRGNGEIRRVNVNVAPLPVDQFRELKATGIGTFQLFQETYHRETYQRRPRRRQEEGLRLARHRHAPRHGGRHRRRRHRRALRPRRLALRDPRHAAAHPRARARLRRRPAHHQRAAPRAGQRLRHGQPPAAAGRRHRLPQDRRHPAAGRAVHRHDPEHARDRRTCARRPSPSASARSAPAAAPTPAATRRTRSSTRPSSSSATTARSTRSSATSPSSASSRASAPPATAWAAPAWTSWTSPSRATSSTTATPTR